MAALLVYIGAAWAVLEVADHAISRFLLPEWVYTSSLVLLLAGLPVVLATAVVHSGWLALGREAADPTLLGDFESERLDSLQTRLAARLTWTRTIAAGLLGLGGLALIAAITVLLGLTRVTEARGSAGFAAGDTIRIVVGVFEASADTRAIADAARAVILVDLQEVALVEVYESAPVQVESEEAGSVHSSLGLAFGTVLTGSAHIVGRDYVLSARLVEVGSGRDLIAVRVVARPERLLEGLERLSSEVRRRMGEAREELLNRPSVAQVATRFLETLAHALEAEDLDQLRRLWTLEEGDAQRWALFFASTRDLSVSYTVESAEVTDSGLRVAARARYEFLLEAAGRQQVAVFNWRIHLKDIEGEWVIIDAET